MPDRDAEHVRQKGEQAFSAFSNSSRWRAYQALGKWVHPSLKNMPKLDAILLDWRWPIPGRNTALDAKSDTFQPDLMLQTETIRWAHKEHVPIIAIDHDYKMTLDDDEQVNFVLEFGWKRGGEHHVDFPCKHDELLQFKTIRPLNRIAYVGNRYERDEAFSQYVAPLIHDYLEVHVYGNWLENERDSASRWPSIKFHSRIHPGEIYDAYYRAICVPLLLKPDYNQHGFMTERVWEAILFGSVPIQLGDFKSDVQYVPRELVANSALELGHIAQMLYRYPQLRDEYRTRIAKDLAFMDVKNFIDKVLSLT